jgi:two-component system, sensor histidine kinase PdtaS
MGKSRSGIMKKIFPLFAMLLLFHHPGYSQKQDQDRIDSLLAELARAKEDTTKLDLLASIIYEHVNYKPKEGLAYQQEALELAEKTRWEPGTAKIKDKLGRLYWRMGNFAEALKNHFEALDIYVQTGNKPAQGRLLLAIGQDYLDDGKYAEARTYLLKAIKVSEDAGDKRTLSGIYGILAYLYDRQGDIAEATKASYAYLKIAEETGNKSDIATATSALAYYYLALGNNTEAVKYFKQVLQGIKEEGSKIEIAVYSIEIANVYTTIGNFSEAMSYYSAALNVANEIKDGKVMADIHHGIGNVYRAQGNYTEALKNYLIAETGFKSVGEKQQLAGLYTEMGMVYTKLKKNDQARKFFNDSKALYEGLNNKLAMGDYYSGLELLDSATGNWRDAYQDHKQYIAIRDSSFNKETLKKLVVSQMQYENEKKEAIVKAEQEKKDVRAQQKIKLQRNIRNSAFAVLAVVLLFSTVVYRQRNKIAGGKKRSDQLLLDKELLLREIHHRVKNNLEVVSSLLALQSAQIDDPYTKEAMQEGQNRVQSIGIVHQKLYQGENLGAIEMKDYFINLSESILDSFGADKKVQIECVMDKLNIDIDTAVPLGLIVNELLTNTLKYAFPDGRNGKVKIKLEKRPDGILQLQVSDNGVGKSGVTQGTGFGGQLVALLTKQLGGSMREEVKNGTNIFFEFKIEKAA